MRVRSLRSLVVNTPGGIFTMAVGKTSETSVIDHLKQMSSSFTRKTEERSACASFAVFGSATLTDETAERIFAETFWIPYEADEDWEFPVDGTKGLLRLVQVCAPSGGTDSQGTGLRSTATVTAPRRGKDKV